MTYISSNEIRKKFLEFMKSKGHAIIPSAPVVPENDPTVLFNTAGMQPLVPYLLGEAHPLGKRLADSQKCIRTNDIDEVGDNSHLTFFEMLGNWSLGDYFKKESIAYSWEFLTSPEWLGLDPKMIAVTVFEGDNDAPRDEESATIWKQVGVPEDRISYLPKSENWWAAGDTGPCGPDTEIFYWVGESEFPPEGSNVANDEDNWMEIWNNVFMEYNKLPNGSLTKLPAQNVDTGMGLERITATINGVKTVYHTDIFSDIITKIVGVLGVEKGPQTQKSIRIIADHSRTAAVMISDGVLPSNVDQGYILRKLIRIAIRQAYKLGYKGEFLYQVSEVVIEKLGIAYPHMLEKKSEIIDEIQKEEKQFGEALEKGLKEFDKLLLGFNIALEKTGKIIDTISGDKAFKLYDTYGFPIEMTQELASEKGLKVDVEGFNQAFAEHQEKSRTASAGKFKGGLADDSEATTELHTATHLLLAGLRKVLGTHVFQKGSNITPERLRFDFSHEEKVTAEELQQVEDFVNYAISTNFDVTMTEMPKQEALDMGVVGSFWEKYPDIVKVYTMKSGDEVFSIELCGGPHATNSSTLGKFKIQKEEASSRGVRRIKAVLVK
ncbi:alanine--tRNA ligase [Candidatus Gracilibacteria bacterium]|nr:alanine--tRNA ligase [Candidatus Gracilibacteria bacterium]